MTRPQIGGYAYREELTRIRNAATAIRNDLSKLLEGTIGPQMLAVTVARTALQLGIILDAIANLERYGREAKDDRAPKDDSTTKP